MGVLAPGGDVDDRLSDDAGVVALGVRVPLAERVEHDVRAAGRQEGESDDDGCGHDAPLWLCPLVTADGWLV